MLAATAGMSANNLKSHTIDLSFCNSEELSDSTDDCFFAQDSSCDSPCDSSCAHPRIVLYSTSTPVSLFQKTAIRRLAQLLDVLQVALRRDNKSLEYEVVDLATREPHCRIEMIKTAKGEDTIPQLHVRNSNGEMFCVGTIQHVEELHDFGVRSC